ncbi:hypothetical protein BS78_09G073000 [Paspalum vaginatum]|nr:hypothetical protein BS78_09G073000 [Paspalum vaginatum]
MDKKTSSRVAIAPASSPAASGGALQSPEPEAEMSPAARSALLALACLLRVAVIALMASSIAPSAWRARGDPWELALITGPCVLLAAMFVCLHRAERLTPDSDPGERRRLHVAVWVLSTGISCLLAYRISMAMPVALVVVIWGMTSLVVLGGFYMLVLYNDQQYQSLDEVHTDDDAKPNKIRHPDEFV